jgi:hypothetical protein
MVAAIAAREGRLVATMDVPGAFLIADLQQEVLMSLESRLSKLLTEISPSHNADDLREDGSLVLALDKGLYGLGEAAKLWYDTISAALLGIGTTRNTKDPCVFNKLVGEDQLTACPTVDDIMATCKNEETFMSLHSELCEKYGAVTFNRGIFHSYLRRTLDFTASGKCDVTMAGYVSDLLDDQKVTGYAANPALEDLFDPGEGELLPLHCGKAPISIKKSKTYLTTRTVGPTANDQMKLERVLRYLNASMELGIVFSSGGVFGVVAYVDASYGVHPDYRSHTGLVLKVGDETIFVKSSKHKINTKSSTEAEVVGVSDSLSQALRTREFLEEQGYVIGAIRSSRITNLL